MKDGGSHRHSLQEHDGTRFFMLDMAIRQADQLVSEVQKGRH